MNCSMPGFPVLHYLPKFAQTHVHWLDEAIQPSHPLPPSSPPALNLSQLTLFQWVSSLHQVSKILELQFQHQSSNEYSGLISFRIDCFDLLVVQGNLKNLLQHHSSKAPTLQWSVSLYSNSCTHTWLLMGKTIALTIWNFLCKVMSLLFNTLPRFVISFLPRSKYL